MAIRYTPAFNKKIRQTVYNYNRRVERLMSKYPTAKNIPNPVTTSGIKNLYENRGDLIRRLKQLENFNEDKMKKTIQITADEINTNQYAYENFRLNKKVAQKKIEHLLQLNQARDKDEGRLIPSYRTRMLKANLKTLHKTDKANYSYKDYTASKNVVNRYTERREATNSTFYENFFDMLWGDQIYAEIDPELIEDIHDMIEQLTPEQLLEMYNRESDISRIVEDYNKYVDTQGYAVTDDEVIRARIRMEELHDALPALIQKYSKY